MIMAILTGLFVQGEQSIVFADAPEGSQLVFRKAEAGIAYSNSTEVIFLSESGTIERKIAIPSECQPLFYDPDQGLVSTPRWSLLRSRENVARDMYLGPAPKYFASNGHLFVERSGVAFLGGGSSYLFSDYNYLSAAGANSKGDVLVHLSLPSTVPIMRVARKAGDAWAEQTKLITPEIDGVGQCTILPGFNDIVFASDDHVVFIGAFVSVADIEALDKWMDSRRDFTRWPLDESPAKEGTCFLFVSRLRDGWTKAVGKLSYHASGEMRGPRQGMMAASADGKFLYIQAHGKILRLSTKEIAALFDD